MAQNHPVFDQYQIEQDGTIHSFISGKTLKPRWTGSHWQVVLSDHGKRCAKYVHHLVLEAFVGPRPEGLKGLHRDDDPHNNDLSNLYWGTSSQNGHDAVRNGKHGQAKKIECKRGHVLEGANLQPWMTYGRGCLACNRAVSLANSRGIKDQEYLQRLSDEKFAEIMKVAV